MFRNHRAEPAKIKKHRAEKSGGQPRRRRLSVARNDVFVMVPVYAPAPRASIFIIENIRQNNGQPQHIIVQELPSTPESFIHLDMIFTFLDTDACMCLRTHYIWHEQVLRTIHIQIDNKKVSTFRKLPIFQLH
jgi:arginine deiminase